MIGYKLMTKHKDGSIGPLFINRRQRLEVGKEYQAEEHLTKGFAFRPGWHICAEPLAPTLKKKGACGSRLTSTSIKNTSAPSTKAGCGIPQRG